MKEAGERGARILTLGVEMSVNVFFPWREIPRKECVGMGGWRQRKGWNAGGRCDRMCRSLLLPLDLHPHLPTFLILAPTRKKIL